MRGRQDRCQPVLQYRFASLSLRPSSSPSPPCPSLTPITHPLHLPQPQTTVGSTHRVEPIANAHGSSAPYARNLGGVISAFLPHQTQVRPRGYGLGNGVGSAPNAEGGYTQPGYPLDPRNPRRKQPSVRRQRMQFSLRDTPLTLQAKEASRLGLRLDEYAAFTDDTHPTKALLQLAGRDPEALDMVREAAATASSSESESTPEQQLVQEAVAGLPTDPSKLETAVRLAAGLAPSPSTVESFESEVAAVLTAEERALIDSGEEASVLRDAASVQQRYIDEYAEIDTKEARKGVEKAIERRDAALAKVRTDDGRWWWLWGGSAPREGGRDDHAPLLFWFALLTSFSHPHVQLHLPPPTSHAGRQARRHRRQGGEDRGRVRRQDARGRHQGRQGAGVSAMTG